MESAKGFLVGPVSWYVSGNAAHNHTHSKYQPNQTKKYAKHFKNVGVKSAPWD